MTEAAWAALTLTLTILGVFYTFWAFRSRGAAAGTRGAALTLLPLSAYLTGTLEMFTEITGSVVDWATSLVLNPVVWTGIGTFGIAVLLLLASARLRASELRRGGAAGGENRSGETRATGPAARRGSLPPSSGRPQQPLADQDDDDMDDIDKILRRHGIT